MEPEICIQFRLQNHSTGYRSLLPQTEVFCI
jgi:hypothetical protein